jgi:D-alanyl-D-alanine carboxypeptidase
LVVGVAVATIAATGCSSGTTAKATPTPTTAPFVDISPSVLTSRLDHLVRTAHAPGGVLGIRVRGGPPLVVATGADPTTKQPFAPTDAFRVASITKTFVGALALRLIEQQRLGLDDPVNKYIPRWPNGDEITVRELLSHTSGIPPFSGDSGNPSKYSNAADAFVFRRPAHRFTPAEILAYVRKRPLLFRPGTRTSYSNVNTILLGEIIARITGRTVGQNLYAELLDPLLLNATKYAAEEKAKWKPGITTIGPSALNTDAINYTGDITAEGAAGALVSTVPDLLTWGEAFLRDRTIVTGTTAETAFRIAGGGTGLGVLGFDARQGFCVFAPRGCVAPVDFQAIGGSGLAAGARTILLYDKPTDTVLALIVDRDQTPGVEALALAVLRLVATAEAKTTK